MTQIINAYGQDIEFPKDMSDEDIATAIKANEAELNPDYNQPAPGLLGRAGEAAKGFAKDNLGVDFDARAQYQASQPPSPTASDYAKGFASGSNKLVSGVGYLAEVLGAKETGKSMRAFGDRGAEFWNEKMTPAGKDAAQTQVFEDDEDSLLGVRLTENAGRALLMGAAQSTPSMFAAAIPGALATKGIQALARLGLAGGAGATVPLLAGTAAPVGIASQAIARAPSAVGFGAAEGLVAGGMNAAEFKTSIEGMDEEELAKSPVYTALREEHDADEAKALLAEQASYALFGKTALSTGVIGAITGGGALAQAYQKTTAGAKGGLVSQALKGAGQEAVQETPQSGAETAIENLTTKQFLDPTQAVGENVLASALTGGATGALMGAVAGGGGAVNITKSARDRAAEVNDQRTQAGVSKIGQANSVEEAIQATQETVSQKTVDANDVLRDADPTLADIERLTGLKPTDALEQAAVAPKKFAAGQADTEARSGKENRITLPSDEKVNARWEVVEADSVGANLVKGEAQPRDRSRAASNAQVQRIASKLDYDRLEASPVLDTGAPALTLTGELVAGNGRFAGIEAAYAQGTHGEYLQALKADAANKGIDPTVIEGMQKPVLVRRITEPHDTRKLAIASNSGLTQEYSSLERATVDAERMKGLTNLAVSDTGEIATTSDNMSVIRDALSGYAANEVSALQGKSGALSQEGRTRVRNALLATAYGDSPTLGRLVESTDPGSRNLLGALMRNAGVVSKVKEDVKLGAIPKDLDITDDLLKSVETLARLRDRGQPLDNFLSQTSFMDEPISDSVKSIMRFLDDNLRSQKRLSEFIRTAYETIARVDNTADDIFGDNVAPTAQGIIDTATGVQAGGEPGDTAGLKFSRSKKENNAFQQGGFSFGSEPSAAGESATGAPTAGMSERPTDQEMGGLFSPQNTVELKDLEPQAEKLAEVSSMSEAEINAEIQAMGELMESRRAEGDKDAGYIAPELINKDLDYLSLEEKARFHELKQALPSSGTEALRAKERIAKRMSERKTKGAEAAASKPAPTAELPNAISDFGEKVGGAKKDAWQSYNHKAASSLAEDVAVVPLSKSWPEPDYQALLDSGADPFAVAFTHAVRDEIPTKPKAGYKLKRWAESVNLFRSQAYRLLEGTLSPETVKAKLKDAQSLDKWASRLELYQLVGHAKSLKGVHYSMGVYSFYEGKKQEPHKIVWAVEKSAKSGAFGNWPTQFVTADTKQEMLDSFKAKYDSLEFTKPKSKEVKFDIYKYNNKPEWVVGKKTGRNHLDLEKFDTVAEAREYKATHQAELTAKLAKMKEVPNERRTTNEPRVGEDMRNGLDVTPQLFADTFGFRGVEFGNYVDNKRRQQDLNDSFDALMDMAAVLDIPAKAISLNGELALAFGARGSGGKGAAKAHYERDRVVINLTKNSGAGSLGHEWWHALDNYFSRSRSEKDDFMTEARDVGVTARGHKSMRSTAVRPEMVEAFGQVVKAIKNTAVRERASKLDGSRSKAYWTTGREMAARSFESYLIAKLHDQNAANDYLANIVSPEAWELEAALGLELEDSYPYPTAGEMPAIRAGFDHFFTTVETKDTESGVALFRRETGSKLNKTAKGIPRHSANKRLVDTLGAKAAKALQDSGKLTLVDRVQDVKKTAAGQRLSPSAIADVENEAYSTRGMTLNDGNVVLVLDELTEGTFDGVLKHEGLHATLKNVLGGETYSKTLSRLDTELRMAKGSKWVKEAHAAVPEGTREADVLEEVAAYAVEQYENGAPLPKGIRRWVENFLSAIRTALLRAKNVPEALRVWALNNLKPQDLARLAVLGLRGSATARQASASEGATHQASKSAGTITVDGAERPTTNSDGKPIHPTKEGLQNFWKWFGDSEAVDDNGKPLVMYHGTNADFDTFNPGFNWMSQSPELANVYADLPGSRVVPAYVRAVSTFDADYLTKGDNTPATFFSDLLEQSEVDDATMRKAFGLLKTVQAGEVAKAGTKYTNFDLWARPSELFGDTGGKALLDAVNLFGFDTLGFTEQGTRTLGVTSSNQIKSAIGNTGDFSTEDDDTRFSRSLKKDDAQAELPVTQPDQPDSRTLPKETKARAAQRTVQDKFNRFTVIKDWLADQGITLSNRADVYEAEERFHSKTANQLDDFREEVRNPLIERITKAGFNMRDIEDYLLAQHAVEANKQVQKVTSDPKALAFGITDAEAREYLGDAKPELRDLANEFRDITSMTKELLAENHVPPEVLAAWDNAYEFYVPVKGGPEETAVKSQNMGSGFKAKYKGKRRLGHGKRDEHVVENVLADYERAVMLVEKNRVGMSLALMAAEMQANGIDNVVTVGQPVKRGVLKSDVSFGVYNGDVLVESFQDSDAANEYLKLVEVRRPDLKRRELTIKKIHDSRVAYTASPMLAENEVNVYIKGHAVRLQIKDDLLARAYTNMGAEALGYILSAGKTLNSYLSSIYTGYSPEFIVTNIVRDFTTGIINISGEEGAKFAAEAVGNYAKSFGSLLVYAKTRKANEWVKRYRAAGGNTGAAYLSDMERLGKDVETEVDSYRGVLANLKDKNVAGTARAAGRKAFNATLKWIEVVNQAGENAMRLSIFQAAIERGYSDNKAAGLAKNSTVNFNRKGEAAGLNAMYLFFNASVQGVAATGHALVKGKHKYQAWGLTGGMATIGYLLAAGLAGGDEDDYDKLSDYTKERNMVIATENGFIKIPVPYGYGFFWNLGRIMADSQRKDELDKAPWRLAASAVSELTPFGSVVNDDKTEAGQLLYALPTVFQIAGAPLVNMSGMGGPVMPDSPFDTTKPDREKMWRGTKGTVFDTTAGWLEAAGLDVSPETLKHYNRTFTGGAGDIVATAASSAALLKEGATLEAKEVPFLRKGYTELSIANTRAAYYEAVSEARAASEEFGRARRNRDVKKLQDIVSEKRELLALNNYANKLAKAVSHKRDLQDALRQDKSVPVAQQRLTLKVMEKEEAKLYDLFLSNFKTRTAEMKERNK